MRNRQRCIRCAVIVIILSLMFIPECILAESIAPSPKSDIISVYLDRLGDRQMRMQEEERALRRLSQEHMLNSLSQEQLAGKQVGLTYEEAPKKTIFSFSRKTLEDILHKLEFNSALFTSASFNDNVDLEDESRVSDWIYTIRPSWDLKLTRGQSYLGLAYTYDFGYYLRNTSPDTQNQKLSAKLFYKPSNIFSFQLEESFEGTNGVDLFKLTPFTIDRFNRAHHRVNASSLSAALTYMPWGKTNLAHLTISDARSYSGDRSLESNSQTIGTNIEHYINPITSVYLGYEFGITDNEESEEEKDKKTQSIVLGLKHDLTNITKAKARFTYDMSQYDDGTDDAGYKLSCSLQHRLSNFTSIEGAYIFGITDTVADDYRRYRTHNLDFALNHQLTQKLSISLDFAYILDNYFQDDFIGAGAVSDKQRRKYDFTFGIDHKLYDWLSLDFTYKFSRALSELEDENSYRNNIYTWGAKFNF